MTDARAPPRLIESESLGGGRGRLAIFLSSSSGDGWTLRSTAAGGLPPWPWGSSRPTIAGGRSCPLALIHCQGRRKQGRQMDLGWVSCRRTGASHRRRVRDKKLRGSVVDSGKTVKMGTEPPHTPCTAHEFQLRRHHNPRHMPTSPQQARLPNCPSELRCHSLKAKA